MRVLTSDELSLKVVCMQSKIQEKIDRKLSSGFVKVEIVNDQGAKKIKKDVPPRPYSLRDHIQGEMTGEFENRKGEPDLPKHHLIPSFTGYCNFGSKNLCRI